MADIVHAVGSKVWVADDAEGWAKAEVTKVAPDHIMVKVQSGEERKCKPEDCPLQNPDDRGVEDMTRLPYLHEPGVLWNIKSRYMVDDIYTYTGTILVAINPFAPLPHLYGPHMMDQYRGKDLGELSPHVYAIADAAYRQMRKEMKGQSILVSGESGAGKTETSKLIMKYLAYMGGYTNDNAGEQARRRSSASGRSVEEQVLESNPLLEAFGNAKTVRNDNSSRFGKYVDIQFNGAGVISGAAIRTYLLERSRVVAVNNPERNFHIFYQLCDGASPDDRARWHLLPAKEFSFLNTSTCFNLAGCSNAEEYGRTCAAMAKVGLSPSDRDSVLQTVAAVLHLGNVLFQDAAGDSSVVKAGPPAQHLAWAAELLGVPPDGLLKALTTRTRQLPTGPITSPLNAKAAAENRNALAKVIYAKMFDWLVARINAAIGEDSSAAASVGVLDIYGFESFESNDFEQFCINLANEKLQQHFNHHVFKQEQAEYEREKIDWSYIKFVDNQDVLDLIEGKMGIVDMLDETCRFPQAVAKDLAEKLYGAPACKASTRFSKPKLSNTAFTIDHYAGDVTYKTDNFLDKNKDYVVGEHQALLQASTSAYVTTLFPPEADGGGAGGGPAKNSFKFNSVGSQFKKQLAELMAALNRMEPHYIRCIKPNNANKAGIFDARNSLHQLRCGGVLEAVRISCAGFPSKRPYAEFVDHFWQLAPELLQGPDAQGPEPDKGLTKALLRHANITGYQMGVTKVFLRGGQMALLDKLRTEKLQRCAVIVQRHVRGWLARRHYAAARAAVVTLQCAARVHAARAALRRLREERAATVLQTLYRSAAAQARYAEAYNAVLVMQAMWRTQAMRKSYASMRVEQAATAIQTAWRGHSARSAFATLRDAAVAVQCLVRERAARAELRQLRSAARESTKLLADKQQLEVTLKEVQGRLEAVQAQRNELRQQLKDEMAKTSALEASLKAADEERGALRAVAQAGLDAKLAAAEQARDAAVCELQALRDQVGKDGEAAAAARSELERSLKTAQEYIGRSQNEKSELDKKFHAMKDELITRLQNACNQRDEARGQVLELQAELDKAREVLGAREKQLVAAQQMAAQANALAQQQPQPAAHDAARARVPSPGELSAPSNTPSTPMMMNGGAAAAGDVGPGGRASFFTNMAAKAQSNLYNAFMTPPPAGAAGGGARLSQEYDGVLGGGATPQTDLERKAAELAAKQHAEAAAKRAAAEERMLGALTQDLGYHKGKPVAAMLIFRCCLSWRAFSADRTTLFDRIIGVIGSQIERQQDDNRCLAYWLTNTSTLLHMLQKNIKPASNPMASRAKAMGNQARSLLGGMFGRSPGPAGGGGFGASPAADNMLASIHGGGVGGFKQVEAKYPALLFKQQLDAFVQKIFPMMRDNVKKQVAPLLASCIHSPKGGSRAVAGARRPTGGAAPTGAGAAAGGASTASAGGGASDAVTTKSWSDVLAIFDGLLAVVRGCHMPRLLVQALFRQLFGFMNVQLFNQLLLRRECCSFSNGEYVKTGLALVENWIQEAGDEWVGDSWSELRYIRQAVTFLVIGAKPKKSLADITQDLCPGLSIQQLYRISTMYWDDMYGTETVSAEVLSRMKQMMVESSASASHSFLLDDDSTLPFVAADVLQAMDERELYGPLPVPAPLKGEAGGDPAVAAAFAFLERQVTFAPPPGPGGTPA